MFFLRLTDHHKPRGEHSATRPFPLVEQPGVSTHLHIVKGDENENHTPLPVGRQVAYSVNPVTAVQDHV